MRLWSLHPALLDRAGLVAVWREALLAQAVLRGRTRGYRHHPQLHRFRACDDPIAAIAAYLWSIHDEATRRGYAFDAARIAAQRMSIHCAVTRGQILHEWTHLKRKLRLRAAAHLRSLQPDPRPHPMFFLVEGPVEPWERATDRRRGADPGAL